MSSQPEHKIATSSPTRESQELTILPNRIRVTGWLDFDASTEQWYLRDIYGEDGTSLDQEGAESVCFGKCLDGFSDWQWLFSGAKATVAIECLHELQQFSPVGDTLRIICPYPKVVGNRPDDGPLTIDQVIYRYCQDTWQHLIQISSGLHEIAEIVDLSPLDDWSSLNRAVLSLTEQIKGEANELNVLKQERDNYQNSVNGRREELKVIEAKLSESEDREKLARNFLAEIHKFFTLGRDIPQGGECDTNTLHQLLSDLREKVENLDDKRSRLTLEVAELQETQHENLTEHKRLVTVLSGLRVKALSATSEWLENRWITEDDQKLLLRVSEDEVYLADESVPSDWIQIVENVHSYIYHRGLVYPKQLIANVLSLICTHDILIFAGEPGCGKTALVRALADAVGASKPAVIAVKPNWTSSEDLFGYWNAADGHFVSTVFTDALLRAANDRDRLHFLCLDELNLARVEYYFADLLSAFEDRTKCPSITLVPQSIGRAQSEKEKAASSIYQYLDVPENVRIIGCINMDETTHAFSSKILDRVHVVRFPDPLDIDRARHAKDTNGSFSRIPLLPSTMPRREEYPGLGSSKTGVESHLGKWRPLLARMGIQLSPRVVRQAVNYRNCLAMMMGEDCADWVARNYTVLQKILPRLEHHPPDQEDSDRRHRAAGEFLRALEADLDSERHPLNELAITVPTASGQLRKMYEDAERLPDKRYRYW